MAPRGAPRKSLFGSQKWCFPDFPFTAVVFMLVCWFGGFGMVWRGLLKKRGSWAKIWKQSARYPTQIQRRNGFWGEVGRCKDVLGRVGNILLAESTFHLLSNNLVGHGLKAGNTDKSFKNPLYRLKLEV